MLQNFSFFILNIFLKKMFKVVRVNNLSAVAIKLHPDDALYDTDRDVAKIIFFDVSQSCYGR